MNEVIPRDGEVDRPARSGHGRLIRNLLIVGYLITLAVAPQWATLGFVTVPMLTGEAELDSASAERFQPISWEILAGFAYDLDMPSAIEDTSAAALEDRNRRLVPRAIRALDGRAVAVRGYVIPIAFSGDRVTEFILAAKNEIGCCFGDGLAMNQWIQVAVPEGESYDVQPLLLATVTGRLEVGEEVRGGIVLSLYRMRDVTIRYG